MKRFLAGALMLGLPAMLAWGQGALQSTAPEPATSPAQAATPPRPATSPSSQLGPAATVKYSFEMLDGNHDDRISKEEAAGSPDLASNFELLDRNRDGYLDRSEFVSFSK